MKTIGKYSIGIGDRFGRQGKAQLSALVEAEDRGINVTPVWNKSHREHSIIGTSPEDVRAEAEAAVAALGWRGDYFVDADHISMANVDGFIESSDFFTLDVAETMGQPADDADIQAFVAAHDTYLGQLSIPGVGGSFSITRARLGDMARSFLRAVQEAGQIYRHIAARKGDESFVTEVSMDETETPQTPIELFFILSAIAREGIPAQTIAPKFSGRFNKGVDYVGDVAKFDREFRDDLAVVSFARHEFGLPDTLKLSVHSGSDKFCIYGPMRHALAETDAGLHLKTAGTTWLEELIGLALGNAGGLEIAKEIYRVSLERMEELCGPYASVIDVDRAKLPEVAVVAAWTGEQFANALRHDLDCGDYNPNLRQLLHVSYKVAAEMGDRFFDALAACEETIAENVRTNLLRRHILKVFPA